MRDPGSIRVLVGCEHSGTVRNAFRDRGFDAWSCDLLPDDALSDRHIVGDVRDVLGDGWDLAILHPPCTRLCNSGVRWLTAPPNGKTLPQMWRELDAAASLFSDCLNAPVRRVAVENPIMHKHAKARIRNYAKPDQTVQPWWFGHEAFKATSLFLHNLPALRPTDKLTPPLPKTEAHKAWSFIHRASESSRRWRLRSKTFAGLAQAMAQQWGDVLINETGDQHARPPTAVC